MRSKHRPGAVKAHVLDHAKVINHGERLFGANDPHHRDNEPEPGDNRCLRCGRGGHTSDECKAKLPASNMVAGWTGLTEADLELARNFAGDRPDLTVEPWQGKKS